MNIIQPHILVRPFNPKEILKNIELDGRVCYKSEDSITNDSYKKFIRDKAIDMKHGSILEHEKLTVIFTVDRGISHEIVRHRIAAYSQESTRYCKYSGGKFGEEITVINPFFFAEDTIKWDIWYDSCKIAETSYMRLVNEGASAQEARSVLPNSLKTEVVTTYNLREWRHFFTLRCSKAAHPQMRQVAIPLLLYLKPLLSPIFDDIPYDEDFLPEHYAEVRTIIPITE